MPVVEDDHVVQTLAANGADHALHIGILPRTKRTRYDLGDAEAGDPPTHLFVVDAVPVSQQPSGERSRWGRPSTAAERSTRRWGAR